MELPIYYFDAWLSNHEIRYHENRKVALLSDIKQVSWDDLLCEEARWGLDKKGDIINGQQ